MFLVIAMVKILKFKAMYFRRRVMKGADVDKEEINLTLGTILAK